MFAALAEKSDKFVCPEEALQWNHRRWRILEEVLTYGADIICLQEVDHYNFLKATLGKVGFQGCFFPKPDSPCCYIKGNNGPDGCAIFFDSSKYTLLKTEQKVLEVFRCQSNQVRQLEIHPSRSQLTNFPVHPLSSPSLPVYFDLSRNIETSPRDVGLEGPDQDSLMSLMCSSLEFLEFSNRFTVPYEMRIDVSALFTSPFTDDDGDSHFFFKTPSMNIST